MFSKHRLEALSDGVFAIAMTLLILDIKVPVGVAKGHLGEALAKDGHGWISFAITFFIASVFWTFQHRLFELLEGVSQKMLVPTFVFLAFVSVLPFSTSLWGRHISEPLALLIYFGNQFAIAAALTVKLELARAYGHMQKSVAADMMRFRLYGMCTVMLAAGLASFFLPLQWVWPVPVAFGLLGRALRNRRERRLIHLQESSTATAPL